MSCNQTPCTCTDPCAPTPCVDGCLLDVASNCVPLSTDITVATVTIPKGTSLTDALDTISSAVSGTINISSSDINAKVSASDTTTSYLTNKIVGGTSIVKSILNSAGNEQIKLDVIRDTVTGGGNNILTITGSGLYVPPSSGGTSTTVSAGATTNTFQPIVNTVSGGYSVSGNVKVDNVTGGNILTVGSNGLYVPSYTPSPSLSVSAVDTSSIDTTVNLSGSTYQVSSALRLDPSSTATVSITSAGLKVDSATSGGTTITVTDSTSIDHTITPITGGYNLTSAAIISPTAGNALLSTGNGLYVPTPSLSFGVGDTNSVDMTLTGSTITSDLRKQDSSTVALTVPNVSGLKADVKISATAGNAITANADGIYASFAISGTCSALTISDVTFDLVQDLEGEVYLRTTPVTNVSFDTIRLNIAYTKLGGGLVNTNVSDIVNRKIAGVSALTYTLLPNFDYNNNQTVTINAAKQCSALNTTAVSADYTTTVGWVAPSIQLDTWINVPSSAISTTGTNFSIGSTLQYKISKNKKSLSLRGVINYTHGSSITTGSSATAVNCTIDLYAAGIAQLLDSSVSFITGYDNFPATCLNSGLQTVRGVWSRAFTGTLSTSSQLALVATLYNDTGSSITSFSLPMSHITFN